jgi:hypothetical protein
MTIQTVQSALTIEWDDSVVFVFSFTGTAGKQFAGFVHQILALQSVTGSQTQVTAVLQTVQQNGIQVSLDPQTWVETVKNVARNTQTQAKVVYDDTASVTYTTGTNQSFTLQQLFSVTG